MNKIATKIPRVQKSKNGMTREIRQEIAEASSASDTYLMSLDLDSMHDQDVDCHYKIQEAFTGSTEQTGPPVDLSRIALGFELVPQKHGQQQLLDLCKSTVIPTARNFMDTQVNGVAWILQQFFGDFPIFKALATKKKVKEAARKLSGLAVGCALIVDTMGLGKTDTACAALSYMAELNYDKKSLRPRLVLVPSAAVLDQWYHTLAMYSNLTVLVVSYP